MGTVVAPLAVTVLVLLSVPPGSPTNTVGLMIEKKNGYDFLFREKRNLTAAPDVTTPTPALSMPTPTVMDSEYLTVASMSTNTTTPQATATAEELLPDFKSPNSFVSAVFEHSDRENMTVALGLCRKNSDVKVGLPTVQTLPVDCSGTGSSDILSCIHDMLKDRLCYQLDAEMFAYLRWLVVTGEPKGKQRRPTQTSLGAAGASDFLFPSNSCVAAAAPQAAEGGVNCRPTPRPTHK